VFATVKPPLDALASVSIRDIPGGTAPNQVAAALAAAEASIDIQRAWLAAEAAAFDALFVRP
jgi:hypothetical protein